MYIVGQERRLVDPPSQVVAGVRTVTTNMDGRDALPRMSRPFALLRVRSPALTPKNPAKPDLRTHATIVVRLAIGPATTN